MASVPEIILGAFALIPSIFKHKPNCLWYWDGQKWILEGGPFSSRQCRLQQKTLVSVGMDASRFRILRKGVELPPFFNPPKGKDGKT